MKTYVILKLKQKLFSKLIWSSTFKCMMYELWCIIYCWECDWHHLCVGLGWKVDIIGSQVFKKCYIYYFWQPVDYINLPVVCKYCVPFILSGPELWMWFKLCVFEYLKESGLIASDFFHSLRFWYQMKAHIFLITPGKFDSKKCTLWKISMKIWLVMVAIINNMISTTVVVLINVQVTLKADCKSIPITMWLPWIPPPLHSTIKFEKPTASINVTSETVWKLYRHLTQFRCRSLNMFHVLHKMESG